MSKETPMHHVANILVTLVMLFGPAAADAAVVSSVFNGRVPCQEGGIGQVCSSAGIVNRAVSWDGVPLDVTLTIPPSSMDGPFPLIVDLHGFSAGKTPSELEQLVPQGYVVLIYSARGQHFSCGFPESRVPDPTLSNPTVCDERGWFRLADLRYEVRDTQYLAGLLVDQGLVRPDIGVTGISFGGGQSLMLAALKDRMMLLKCAGGANANQPCTTDSECPSSTCGKLETWTSPGACTPTPTSPGCGVPMSVAVAAPLIGWSDLAYALVPNGRTLDYRALNPYFELGVSERAGVMKASYVDVLYDAGIPTAYYAPAGADPDADINAWRDRLHQGEPYDDDPLLRHAVQELLEHHSGYYVDDSIEPAPLWIYNAFTDDIMPPVQALKYYNKTKSLYPAADISLQFADGFAHPRGNLGSPNRSIQSNRVSQHLTYHLSGTGTATPAVEVYTQACSGSTQAGPFTAADWSTLRQGEVRHADANSQTFDSTGGDPANAAVDDPVGATFATACRTVPTSTDDPGAATYRMPVVGCSGYTLVGSPTVIADLDVTGDVAFAEIAGRLWDVASDGSQSLVTHGLYRPRLDNLGPQVIQLEPAGWEFAVGHQPKLELLGQSDPYGRASNGTFSITVINLELRLPVLETPDTCVDEPAAAVFPPSAVEGPTPTPGATATPEPTPAAHAVLGKRFQVKSPFVADKHKLVAIAREHDSDDPLNGNPIANGATLRVVTRGGTDSDQSFNLPKEGWQAISTLGFKYSNRVTGGAVRKVVIKRSTNHTFLIRVLIRGKDGPLQVVPPNPGDDGGFFLSLNGGDSYCVGFGGAAGGEEKRDDAEQWFVKNAIAEVCPVPPGTIATPTPSVTPTLTGSPPPVMTPTMTGTTTPTPTATPTVTSTGGETPAPTVTVTATPGIPTPTPTATAFVPFNDCGGQPFPTCDGTGCPAGEECAIVFGDPMASDGGCACVPVGPGQNGCGSVPPAGCAANGQCPPGTSCFANVYFGGGCGCFQTGF